MKKIKTLIVEDNEKFRQSLVDLLHHQFPALILEEVATGGEALAKVISYQPALIFLDLELPGENGLSLTQKIRKIFPLTTIIILTGYDLPEYREAALERGADYFLAKSSTSHADIINLVQNILSSFNSY